MDIPTAPCPSCFADRPYPLTVTEGTFLPGSDCPACGQVEPDLEFEVVASDGSADLGSTLVFDAVGTRATADGVIAPTTADGVITPATDGVITPATDGVITPATDGVITPATVSRRARSQARSPG